MTSLKAIDPALITCRGKWVPISPMPSRSHGISEFIFLRYFSLQALRNIFFRFNRSNLFCSRLVILFFLLLLSLGAINILMSSHANEIISRNKYFPISVYAWIFIAVIAKNMYLPTFIKNYFKIKKTVH